MSFDTLVLTDNQKMCNRSNVYYNIKYLLPCFKSVF